MCYNIARIKNYTGVVGSRLGLVGEIGRPTNPTGVVGMTEMTFFDAYMVFPQRMIGVFLFKINPPAARRQQHSAVGVSANAAVDSSSWCPPHFLLLLI